MTTVTPLKKTTTSPVQNLDRLVREQECRQITGLSRQRRWEMEKDGRFPKRISLGTRSVAWRLSELQAWISEVAETRAV
ncbi:helix-turn-helix transcriptional regulator [Vibrio sp. MEBiC08052]|uniref:helix-turn-helix transcriptional regulator n=1 Tax=Vibrio sp. MEBiC08052 TaxID=1761910 RepID=UPI00074089AA|nr:AlpA family phage regulatory protein [Vibrio sp. MEBiC08052]KUJ00569.1 DNA-binding protein, putative [Vibrio sp. MEBiC08052]